MIKGGIVKEIFLILIWTCNGKVNGLHSWIDCDEENVPHMVENTTMAQRDDIQRDETIRAEDVLPSLEVSV